VVRMDRPRTEAPQTQVYFIKHGTGAFPALRLRTVNAGERASRSIVNRTTASWSIRIVTSLILSGSTYLLGFVYRPAARRSLGAARMCSPAVLSEQLVSVNDYGANWIVELAVTMPPREPASIGRLRASAAAGIRKRSIADSYLVRNPVGEYQVRCVRRRAGENPSQFRGSGKKVTLSSKKSTRRLRRARRRRIPPSRLRATACGRPPMSGRGRGQTTKWRYTTTHTYLARRRSNPQRRPVPLHGLVHVPQRRHARGRRARRPGAEAA